LYVVIVVPTLYVVIVVRWRMNRWL